MKKKPPITPLINDVQPTKLDGLTLILTHPAIIPLDKIIISRLLSKLMK
jgi:hypothetical protein